MRSLAILAVVLTAMPAFCARAQDRPVQDKSEQDKPVQDRPAATMHDLQTYFGTCFQPPQEADGTRITFYFSLKSDGEIFGRPRLVWLGYSGSVEDRKRLVFGFRESFAQCLPLQLDAEMARTIPGKVYFLQYIVGAEGSAQVLLRPFGSMGDPLVNVPDDF